MKLCQGKSFFFGWLAEKIEDQANNKRKLTKGGSRGLDSVLSISLDLIYDLTFNIISRGAIQLYRQDLF